MPSYRLDVSDLYRSDPGDFYETTRGVAGRVASEYRVSVVRFRGLADALRDRDSGAFSRLKEELGGGEGWMEGEVSGEYVDDVLGLFGRGLTGVVFRADEPVFALFDDGQVYFELPENAVKELGLGGRAKELEGGYSEGVLEAVAEWDDDEVEG